mmetsp:Transcript_43514/g.110778  ORF Transcript_43514/g.110778 Transcript_43514/m.110778 type:complete len:106 (+) Transcript_43514:340-657(+)
MRNRVEVWAHTRPAAIGRSSTCLHSDSGSLAASKAQGAALLCSCMALDVGGIIQSKGARPIGFGDTFEFATAAIGRPQALVSHLAGIRQECRCHDAIPVLCSMEV